MSGRGDVARCPEHTYLNGRLVPPEPLGHLLSHTHEEPDGEGSV